MFYKQDDENITKLAHKRDGSFFGPNRNPLIFLSPRVPLDTFITYINTINNAYKLGESNVFKYMYVIIDSFNDFSILTRHFFCWTELDDIQNEIIRRRYLYNQL